VPEVQGEEGGEVSATLVLLSGGLDSVAALLLETKHGADRVEAVFFRYGQPMMEREYGSAKRVCEELGVTLHMRNLEPVFHAFRAGLMASPATGRDETGKDTAFLPGRNSVLLSVAASMADQLWPQGSKLVVGFNRGDAEGFPDCRAGFCNLLETSLLAGGSQVRIRAPWVNVTKPAIVEWVRREMPGRLALLEQSWSCYSGTGPCGVCTACVTRAEAFA
jgi:queuosine biosynthesis protein QueC